MSKRTIERATRVPRAPRRSIQNAAACVVESLDERKMFATYDLGININNVEPGTASKAIPVLKELGVKTVRIWAGVGDNFNHRWFGNPLKAAIEYGNAGFDVMMIIQSDKGQVPTPQNVKNWFNWALSNSALKNAVDRWQIGNEMDHSMYWKGDWKSYINNFLKPASEALRAQGEKVVSGGPSWNPQDVQTMINNGLLNYVDYVGFHPYANGATLQKQRIDEINKVVAGRKPLVASEWNTYLPGASESAWQEEIKKGFTNIKNGFDLNYYFALIRDTTSAERGPAGPAGIMTTGGAKTSFFYALQAALKGSGGSSSGGSTSNPGNTPSAIPSVAKISVYNADTNKLIIDSLANGQTIDIASIGTRNLSIVAVTASGTKSVKFVVDGSTTTESAAPFASFGDNNNGDYYGKVFQNGTHTVSATPYSGSGASGTAGSTRSFTFTIKDSRGTSSVTTPPPATSTGGPGITKISVYNADTNKVISGYDSLDNGDVLDLKKLGVQRVALVATAANGTESVKMVFNGQAKIEDLAPYAYFGDNMKGDFYGSALAAGTYTLSAQAFTGNGASGKGGETKSLSFQIVNGTGASTPVVTPSTSGKPTVQAFKLINASTGADIPGQTWITSDKTISLNSLPTRNLKLVALTSGAVGSVRFSALGKTSVDNDAPFTAVANEQAFHATASTYWFRGIAYSGKNQTGTVGSPLGLTIKFVN